MKNNRFLLLLHKYPNSILRNRILRSDAIRPITQNGRFHIHVMNPARGKFGTTIPGCPMIPIRPAPHYQTSDGSRHYPTSEREDAPILLSHRAHHLTIPHQLLPASVAMQQMQLKLRFFLPAHPVLHIQPCIRTLVFTTFLHPYSSSSLTKGTCPIRL